MTLTSITALYVDVNVHHVTPALQEPSSLQSSGLEPVSQFIQVEFGLTLKKLNTLE